MTQLKNLVSEWKYRERYVCELHGAPFNGGLCGYVGVPKGHPIYGLHYDDVMEKVPSIGERLSLTYSTETSEPEDGLWFVGFHPSDIRDVKMDKEGRFKDYVDPGRQRIIEMTEWLAKQLEEEEDKK